MMYVSFFKLTDQVDDFEAANDFFRNEDKNLLIFLRDFLRENNINENIIESINWRMLTVIKGRVEIETTRFLTEIEAKLISDWIADQNCDGIGENFCSQEFANYKLDTFDEDYCNNYSDTWEEDRPYDEISCKFDPRSFTDLSLK